MPAGSRPETAQAGTARSTGRRGERKTFALLAGGFFTILFGSYLGQNVGLAILLERHGAAALPRAYVANAAVLAVMSSLSFGFLTRRRAAALPLRVVMIGVFSVGAVVVQSVRLAHTAGLWWAPGAVYVTAFALTDLVTVLFWSVANRVYDTRDAKRFFPLVSAAGTLGAAVSGFFARAVALRIGTVALLDLWAALLVACAVWSHFAAGRSRDDEEGEGDACVRVSGAVPVAAGGLLWAIGTGLVFVVTVTLFGRYLYGRALQAAFPGASALAAVNGLLIGVSNVLTLLVQLFVASRIMSRLGVGGVGAVYPVLMLGAFAGLYAHFGMTAAVVCFFGITTVRRGIQGVVETVLYTPLPPEVAGRSLVLMATVGTPSGLALAGVGLELLGTAEPETVALVGLAAAAACGLAAVWRSHGYREALRRRLLRGGSDVRIRFGALLDSSDATVESVLSEGLDPDDPDLLERLRTLVRARQQAEERGAPQRLQQDGRDRQDTGGRFHPVHPVQSPSGRRAVSRWDESGPLGRVVDARLAESYRLHAALEALPALQGEDGEARRRLENLWRSAIRQRIGENIAVVLAALRAGTHLADFDRISLRVLDADRRVRAAAVEILETLCPEGVRPLVLPLLEENRLAEGARLAKRRYGGGAELVSGAVGRSGHGGQAADALATLLDIPDDWVRATTAYASAHLARQEVAPKLPRLRELASSPDRFVSFAARYALASSSA